MNIRALSLMLLGLVASCSPVEPPLLPERAAWAAPAPLAVEGAFGRVAEAGRRRCANGDAARSCDFRLEVDGEARGAPNATLSYDGAGAPVVGVNAPLLRAVRNEDELAFVLAHEMAHHIADHHPRLLRDAMQNLSLALDAPAAGLAAGHPLATTLAARRAALARSFELEADRIGAELLAEAGYDVRSGVAIIDRIAHAARHPLASHPSRSTRLAALRPG